MTEEKKIILDKIDVLLSKRKAELLKELPSVHDVDDGIIIRFFTEWDNCEDDNTIKFKKLNAVDNEDESIVFFFIPKDALFDLKQRYYIGCITCLNGIIDITVNNETRLLEHYTKMCINSADVQGKAYENTYLIVTSNKSEWSEETREHRKMVNA